ncbi:hypothetical protein E2C01_090204 [Portunus trituberculatus]|uniref:Uncharacterized protein n=1 Tax=Portunus trituberculatus TaxID=210409 RepID=A0A5B7JFS4_PORTR|nr:hypothetical protein [Portunus trituberculatus]
MPCAFLTPRLAVSSPSLFPIIIFVIIIIIIIITTTLSLLSLARVLNINLSATEQRARQNICNSYVTKPAVITSLKDCH